MASAVPDFGALAQQQNSANTEATNLTNWTNRPNQFGPMGSTVWNMNPGGTWDQRTSLNGGAQSLFDTTLAGQQGLAGTIAGGVNYGNLPAMPDSGFGASQQVIDAWNALQAPGLSKQADADRARAAAMGITLGSNASNDVERTIGNNWSDASNKAILAGTTEYGNVFNRGLQARQQGVTEANNAYDRAVYGANSLGTMRDSLNPNKWNSNVPAAAAYTPTNIYGAALDTFSANRANENASTAQSNANRAATMGAINTGLGVAGQIGYGNIWGGAKDLWNWASGGSGGGSGGGDFVSDPGATWASQQNWN